MDFGKTERTFVCAVLAAFVMLGFWLGADREEWERPLPRLLDDAGFRADLARSAARGAAGVAVVAPGSGLRGENAARAREMARRLGVSFAETALDEMRVPYNATDDDTRLELLVRALTDPEIDVVWALRGGYGAGRLLARLSETPGLDRRKVFVGYSDMTFLHLFLQRENWRTVHAAMFWDLNGSRKGEENLRRLAALLAGRVEELRYDGLEPCNDAARRAASPIEGVMTGGNLTCVAALCGTPWALEPAGKILMLEDVKESGYKIDRMLTQLRAAGAFEGAAAVVLGSFSRGDEHTEYALRRFAEDFPGPVFRTDLFGHGEKNYPLVFGAPAVISAEGGEKGTRVLRIPLEGGLAGGMRTPVP